MLYYLHIPSFFFNALQTVLLQNILLYPFSALITPSKYNDMPSKIKKNYCFLLKNRNKKYALESLLRYNSSLKLKLINVKEFELI